MGSGNLDQLITLQAYSETSDGAGGTAKTWADFATDPDVWAAVKAKATREVTSEARTTATGTFFFTIYNRTDVSEKDRIVWDSENYNIRGVMREGGRNLMLVIEAERGAAT